MVHWIVKLVKISSRFQFPANHSSDYLSLSEQFSSLVGLLPLHPKSMAYCVNMIDPLFVAAKQQLSTCFDMSESSKQTWTGGFFQYWLSKPIIHMHMPSEHVLAEWTKIAKKQIQTNPTPVIHSCFTTYICWHFVFSSRQKNVCPDVGTKSILSA